VAVFRVAKQNNFTTMSNHHLKNRNLSLKACGLLSKILSLPDEWDYSLRGLSKIGSDGIDSVRSAVNELEAAGYIIRRQLRNSRGGFASSEYLVFETPELANPMLETPSSENPTTVNPVTGKPVSEKPTQLNTNKAITKESNTLLINNPSINHSVAWYGSDGIDKIDEREKYREIICENIEYEYYRKTANGEKYAEIIEIMLDAICSSNKTIRINGEEMPQPVVKSRLLKVTSSHIEYVFDCMKDNPSDIRNIRAYLLTTLYNAPLTMDNYYTARVNHDFNGF